jgi:hypothetical protein
MNMLSIETKNSFQVVKIWNVYFSLILYLYFLHLLEVKS